MVNEEDSATDSDKSSSSKSYCHLTVINPSSPPDKTIVTTGDDNEEPNESSPASPTLRASIRRHIESESHSRIDFSNVEIPQVNFKSEYKIKVVKREN